MLRLGRYVGPVALILTAACAAVRSGSHQHLTPEEQLRTRELQLLAAPPTIAGAVPHSAVARTPLDLADAVAEQASRGGALRVRVGTVRDPGSGPSQAGAEAAGETPLLLLVEVALGEAPADGWPRLLSLQAVVRRAAAAGDGQQGGVPPAVAVASVSDPVPRTIAEWTSEDGRAIRLAVAALVGRAADRLVSELTSVTGDVEPRSVEGETFAGVHCGLAPAEDLRRGWLKPGRTTLRWAPLPTPTAPAPLTVSYEVGVWRATPQGFEPWVRMPELTAPAIDVTLEAGTLYAFAARAEIRSPGGRSWTTAWSHLPTGGRCVEVVEPWQMLNHRVGRAGGRTLVSAYVRPSAGQANQGWDVTTRAGCARLAFPDAPVQVDVPKSSGGPSGGQAGAIVGAASALACGPALPLCLVPLALLGGVRGAIESREPSPAEVLALSDPRLHRGLSGAVARLRYAAIGTALAGAAGGACSTADPGGGGILEVRLLRAALRASSTEGERTSLEVLVEATLRPPGGPSRTIRSSALGPGPLTTETWLADDGAVLRGALEAQTARAARGAVGALDAPAAEAGR